MLFLSTHWKNSSCQFQVEMMFSRKSRKLFYSLKRHATALRLQKTQLEIEKFSISRYICRQVLHKIRKAKKFPSACPAKNLRFDMLKQLGGRSTDGFLKKIKAVSSRFNRKTVTKVKTKPPTKSFFSAPTNCHVSFAAPVYWLKGNIQPHIY